jgi:hypothetical protein
VHFFCLLLLLGVCQASYAQRAVNISSVEVTGTSRRYTLLSSSHKLRKANFYEDSFFVASTECHGEWGGSMTFKDKYTGIEYIVGSTCPIAVHKVNGTYYVISSLAHLSGHADIKVIPNLKSLPRKLPHKSKYKGFLNIDTTDTRDHSNAYATILDTHGVTIRASFVSQDQIYFIVAASSSIFLAILEHGRLQSIVLLASDHARWRRRYKVHSATNGHRIIFFNNLRRRSYIDIFGSSVVVLR